MNPTPEPLPGLFADSCGTPYEATKDKRGQWWLKKMGRVTRNSQPEAYPKPDFVAAVNAGIFRPLTDHP